MTDRQEPGQTDGDVEHIEALLREITAADAELVDLPADLWSRIETDVAESGDESKVVGLDQRRRFSTRIMAISAAAAAAVVIVGSIAIVAQRDDGEPTIVASAELTYDPESFDELGVDAAASVSLVDDAGTLRVTVDESNLPSPNGESADLELWLIQPDDDGNPEELVSLGLIDPERPGVFDVPGAYDPGVFFVVDISVEPRDGDVSHSGRSILRGSLTEA